jgi:4-aminobutyrate aminotransferase-like enzyme
VPPLVITDAEARQGIGVIDDALEVTDRYAVV